MCEALARCDGEPEARWVTAGQDWTILDERVALRPGSPICTRGDVGPMRPYLPNGAYR